MRYKNKEKERRMKYEIEMEKMKLEIKNAEIRAQNSGSGVSLEDAEDGDERDGNSAACTEFKMPLFDKKLMSCSD